MVLSVRTDNNRGFLLEVGFPQVVVSLLEGYAERLPAVPRVEPYPLTIPHLKVVKTAIGVVLNLSLGYGDRFSSYHPFSRADVVDFRACTDTIDFT